jgi:putative ABC transport system permease protein
MIARLVLAFVWERPWQFALAVALCALGLASAISIVWLQSMLETHARRQAEGIDVVVGAQGSPLQNVLAAVYYLDVPNGNIRLSEVDALRAHPQVAQAIPIAMGDSVAGARIVGTTSEFVSFYGASVAAGALPSAPMDAVVGAAVAARTGLKVGDNFVGAHGLGDGGAEHDAHPYRVSGLLSATGRVIDQAVVTPLESVWLAHEGHASSSEKEATFALLRLKSPIAMATLPRLINQRAGLLASVPAMESARLLASFEWVTLIVKGFAAVLVCAAMASLLGALLQALARQAPELALLRAMGASRPQLAALMVGESLLLVWLAALLAGLLTALGIGFFAHFGIPGLVVDVGQGFLFWLAGLLLATLMAIVATIPVLWRSASVDVAAQLSLR